MAKGITKSTLWVCVIFVLVGSLLLASCKNSPQQNPATTAASVDAAIFTVVFRDYDGEVLERQSIASGQPAAAPADPNREGGRFIGWDRDFQCVTEDMTVTAQYAWTVRPTVVVVSTVAKPGQSIRLPIAIVNNPGVAGAKITISYDPALTLTDSSSGEAFSVLDYTMPGKYMSPCSFTWDSEKGMADSDGTILWMTFEIPPDAPTGKTYSLNCICKKGDFFDEALVDVAFDTINGTITVE